MHSPISATSRQSPVCGQASCALLRAPPIRIPLAMAWSWEVFILASYLQNSIGAQNLALLSSPWHSVNHVPDTLLLRERIVQIS